ncbi:hypothetical protein CEUSTIGMA_g7898.t1 [Chlamydomonas eustigma]|uniref:Membrane transporter protein n=1 Tax=Chlamydomonas eustigma TaxID=1157962 RepID=A0A250XC32_9CHLO|nr:hypothetical protein CEUSTIGMA_g7898.t1 [Chlamydomonas eustigma]|eukprot:GAX80459.1 hypothetical protein CEUSTIGMA_g7898.t1 [Chlamydomonas eustigma]
MLSSKTKSSVLSLTRRSTLRAPTASNTSLNYLPGAGRAPHNMHAASSSTGLQQSDLSLARRMSLWVGALAGGFGSMVGVGGGGLISPIIANSCKSIPQRVISGTSLAAVIVTGATSGVVFHAHGEADFTSAAVVALTAVLMAPLGAKATHLVDSQRLRMLMGYWLYFVAAMVPLKTYLPSRNVPLLSPVAQQQDKESALQGMTSLVDLSATPPSASLGNGTQSSNHGPAVAIDTSSSSSSYSASASTGHYLALELRDLRPSDAVLAATGVVAGFASGLFGVGGGTIVTPALALFAGMGQTQAVGTSLMAMVLPSIVALTQHASLGNVDWRMAAGLGAGTLIGSSLGSNMAVNAPPMLLEGLFAIGIAYLGHKMLAGLKIKQ